MRSGIIRRRAIRAVLLTPEGRILLMRLQEPVSGRQVWITPGGAVERGETAEVGLRRELEEETGLQDARVGPKLWTRTHEFTWNGQMLRQREEFYLVETAPFEPAMEDNPATGERLAFRGFRWWSAEELRNTSELFAPRRLADLLEALVRAGPPEEPFDVGI
jgi:ADP-ribose pyrophosphatase YjhB (NUDIX family)